MPKFYDGDIPKSPRIPRLIEHLYAKMPEIEADRAAVPAPPPSDHEILDTLLGVI